MATPDDALRDSEMLLSTDTDTESGVTDTVDLSPDPLADGSPEMSEVDEQLLAAVTLATHKLEKRHRRIEAHITLPYTCDQVWQVLTDYEGLADFIPNLATSQKLDHPDGGIRLEQVGVQSALFLKFSARVVLDMVEQYPASIAFEMVEGDFNSFAGVWELTPSADDAEVATQLSYILTIGPKRITPVFAIEQRLRHDLPRNLVAIRQHLDALHGGAD